MSLVTAWLLASIMTASAMDPTARCARRACGAGRRTSCLGTSTYDGLSIAWALVEHLCKDENRARTMFATHYHELTVLSDTLKGIKNLNVEVRQDNGKMMTDRKSVV